MKKRLTAWILAILLLCAAAATFAEMPSVDRTGNPISLPERIETIVSLAPSITQVIVDLGVGEKLVAIDTYSAAIEGVPEGLPAFDMMAPDAEQIVALSPDVVLVGGMTLSEGEDPLKKLADLSISVVYIPSSNSIAGILEDTLFIGQVVGNPQGAQSLNDALSAAVDALRVDTDDPIPVYFEISPMPYLYSFGSGTFLNEMIELLGGRNIFADQEGWLSVSEEPVIAANPRIIFTNIEYEEDAVASILARAGWESVPAVQNGRVYLIDDDASSQPNHRIIFALEEMAAAFQ